MTTIAQSQIDLDKQITRNRIISLFLILVFLLSVGVAFYYYDLSEKARVSLKASEKELSDTVKKLEKTIATNKDLQKTVALQDSLKAVKKKQDEAIQLLGVFLKDAGNNSSEQDYTSEYILKNLTSLATKEKAKIDNINNARRSAIKQLYSPTESKRKSATNELIREFGDDKRLVKELLNSVMNEKHFKNEILDKEYSNSYYQVLFILTKLSSTSLRREKDSIEKFRKEMEKAKIWGNIAQDNFNVILNKIKNPKG